MNSFKCYNSYIGLKPMLIMYVGYPIVVGVYAMIQLGFMHMTWMMTGVFCLVMLCTMTLLYILDRWYIGPIFVDKGQDDELIKSSARGAEFIKNVLLLDIIFRFILMLALTIILVAVMVISGYFEEYKVKILTSALVFLLATDGVCNLTVIICRLVNSSDEAVVALLGLGMTFIPAVAAIMMGLPVVSFIIAGIYLGLDIVSIAVNIKKTKELVNVEWYKD